MGGGVRRPPARGGVPFARRLRFAHLCSTPTDQSPQTHVRPETARLQALAYEFWPVLGGQAVGTVDNPDRKQYRRRRWSHSPLVLPSTAGLQALASEFWPVLGGSIVRTVQNSDRKVWVSGWWCQRGRGCLGRNGTKFTPDPQKSHVEPFFCNLEMTLSHSVRDPPVECGG